MSVACGLDLGSRRTKIVVWNESALVEQDCLPCWALAKDAVCLKVQDLKTRYGDTMCLGSTGYGRHAAAKLLGAAPLTEIRAFGMGAAQLAQGTRTLVDVGGQDAKAMLLDDAGLVQEFEMNDRCAAGTGKFFELVATTLGVSLAELSPLAESATETIELSSVCAVFAESEIIGRLADGAVAPDLAAGVFASVATRLNAMLQRTGCESPAMLVGGGANPALAKFLSKTTGVPFHLHPAGEFFGAVGAAQFAIKTERRNKE